MEGLERSRDKIISSETVAAAAAAYRCAGHQDKKRYGANKVAFSLSFPFATEGISDSGVCQRSFWLLNLLATLHTYIPWTARTRPSARALSSSARYRRP